MSPLLAAEEKERGGVALAIGGKMVLSQLFVFCYVPVSPTTPGCRNDLAECLLTLFWGSWVLLSK